MYMSARYDIVMEQVVQSFNAAAPQAQYDRRADGFESAGLVTR